MNGISRCLLPMDLLRPASLKCSVMCSLEMVQVFLRRDLKATEYFREFRLETVIHKIDKSRCCQICWERGTLSHCWWDCELAVQTAWKSVWANSSVTQLHYSWVSTHTPTVIPAYLCLFQHYPQWQGSGTNLDVHKRWMSNETVNKYTVEFNQM